MTASKSSKSSAKKSLRQYSEFDPEYHMYKTRVAYSPSLFTGFINKSTIDPLIFREKWSSYPREHTRGGLVNKGIDFALHKQGGLLYDRNMNMVDARAVRNQRYYVITIPERSSMRINNKALKKAKKYIQENPDTITTKFQGERIYNDMVVKELAKTARHRRITRKSKSPLERR